MAWIKDAFFDAWRTAEEKARTPSEEQKIKQAFKNGMAVGLCVGCFLASVGWVLHFWILSLAK